MSVFDYSASIEITFDKAILSDPEIVTGTEEYEIWTPLEGAAHTPLSSGDNASYPKANAFDQSTSTYWRSSSTTAGQWIGRDFAEAVTVTKVVARFDYSSGRPNAYQLQGSDDGSAWADVATGNFTNASGDQTISISSTTYRYWRLYFTTKYSSYYTCTELSFYGTRNTFAVPGWTVSANEYKTSPGGTPVLETYIVRKVTKPDNYTIKLWLDLADRMKYPAGDVTVAYDGLLGNLRGANDAAVESFSISATAVNITPIFNPQGVENIEIASVSASGTISVVTYSSAQDGTENIEIASLSATGTLIHIDNL